jgi:hypothetical protein
MALGLETAKYIGREAVLPTIGLGLLGGTIRVLAGDKLGGNAVEWAGGGAALGLALVILTAFSRAWQFRNDR